REEPMTEAATTVAGFLLGLFGSWLFWRYLLLLAPTVRISPHVLKGKHLLDEEQTVYRIKIYNDSSRQVIDLMADVSLWERRGDKWRLPRVHLPDPRRTGSRKGAGRSPKAADDPVMSGRDQLNGGGAAEGVRRERHPRGGVRTRAVAGDQRGLTSGGAHGG